MKENHNHARKDHSAPRPRICTFADYVLDAVYDARQMSHVPDAHAPDLLAEIEYKTELAIKREAFRRFWHDAGFTGNPAPVEPSPRPRHYRTTSKRRIVHTHGKYCLDMGYGKAGAPGEKGYILEAELHGDIYNLLYQLLNLPKNEEAVDALNFCIIRGGYEEAALIFNVYRANGEIVRKIRMMAEEIRTQIPGLISAFLLLDESHSEYYLDNTARAGKKRMFKKFFGPEILVQPLDGKKLFYPPDVFSQVNGSMAEHFAETAVSLLNPDAGSRVIDLYCGYGLLTMKAAAVAGRVQGIDWEGPSIRAAAGNAAHLFPEKKIRFDACAITGDALKELLPPCNNKKEFILLDPPRSGAPSDVMEAIASRKPERIVHIFCGTDTVPASVNHWLSNGFHIADVRLLDMFPGTANLETMIVLEPGE